MKFTTSIVMALASIGTAAPLSRRTADPTGTQAAIDQWRSDIAAVNNFLNTFQNISDPAAAASALLPIALDEPVQLRLLAGEILPTNPTGAPAIANLMQNFPTVPNALMNIAASKNDSTIVNANVNVINSIRCAVVLPNIGTLFNAAAGENGLGTQDVPGGPTNACATILPS